MKEKTSWGHVAGWYDDLLEKSSDSFQEKVILPNLLRIISPNKNISILDIACGQGYFSRAFQKEGALVTGVDISRELVELAKKNSPKEISYFVSPAEKVSNVFTDRAPKTNPARQFDVATIILAIQNIADMKTAFIEAAKLLKPSSGRLILVINHPIFRIPGKTSWVWDEEAKSQYRRIDSYMSDSQSEIDMSPGKSSSKISNKTISFHRPLQSYFKALNSAGFVVTRLEEWISHKQSQKGPRSAEEDRIRKEIPLFMCIEARKI